MVDGPHPTPGQLFLNPTSAEVGGTQIKGIEERMIQFSWPSDVVVRRSGVGTGSGFISRLRRDNPAILAIPFRSHSANAIKILWSHLTTSGTGISEGAGTHPHEVLPSFSLIVRPLLDTENYIYAPKWRLMTENDQGLLYHRLLPVFSNNTLFLIANDPEADVEPVMWDSSTAIDLEYFPEEEA